MASMALPDLPRKKKLKKPMSMFPLNRSSGARESVCHKHRESSLAVSRKQEHSIGNGFDAANKLSTSYEDFKKYLIQKCKEDQDEKQKDVLDNPIYMGKLAYGRRKTEKKLGTRNALAVPCCNLNILLHLGLPIISPPFLESILYFF